MSQNTMHNFPLLSRRPARWDQTVRRVNTHPAGSAALIGLLGVLSIGAHRALSQAHAAVGFGLLGLAGLLLALAASPLPPATISMPPDHAPRPVSRLRQHIGVTLLVGSGLLLIQAVWRFADVRPSVPPNRLYWEIFVTGLALGIGGVLMLTRAAPRPRSSWLQGGMLLLIVGLATFLRLYRFEDLPFGIWYDEAINGLYAQDVQRDSSILPFFLPNISGPHIYLYARALDLIGDRQIESLRFVSALFGVGSVIAAYAVGRRLHGFGFGLIMALLLAASSWSINFSRVAMTGVETGFFTLLAFYFLVRLVQDRQPRDALWLGLAVGSGLWFYSAFRFMVVALGLYGVIAWRWWLPGRWRLIALAAVTTLITISPFIIFTQIDPDLFMGRTRQVSILTNARSRENRTVIEALRYNSEKHLLMFHVEGDRNGRHNLPRDPMLDPLTGILFGLGVVVGLRRLRQAETWFFLLVLILGLMAAVLTLTFEAPQALRSIGVLPAVAYFGALAAWAIAQTMYRTRALRPVLALLGLILVVGVPYLNYDKYFNRQANNLDCWLDFSAKDMIAVQQGLAFARTGNVYVSTLLSWHPYGTFLGPDVHNWQPLNLYDPLPLRVPATSPARIIFHPDELRFFELAQRLYPDAKFQIVRPSDYGVKVKTSDPVQAYIIDLKLQDIAAVQGLEADGSGVLYVPQYGPYRFDFEPDVQLTIDGQQILPDRTFSLAQGNHTFRLEPPDANLMWMTPGHHVSQLVPEWALYHAPVTSSGLHARFFDTIDWQGNPVLERIDPALDTYYHEIPMSRPYSVIWTGWLHVPPGGIAGLGLQVIQSAEIYIDGEQVLASTRFNEQEVVGLPLVEGRYAIEVRFVDNMGASQIHLRWSLDGQQYESIPTEALEPSFDPYLPGG